VIRKTGKQGENHPILRFLASNDEKRERAKGKRNGKEKTGFSFVIRFGELEKKCGP